MKINRRILAVFLCLALVFTGAGASFANVGSTDSLVASEAINNEDIQTSKTVVYDEETDSYKLVVESYVTGQTTTVTVDSTKATDFVISLDTSHSMVDCINCGTTPVESKSTAKPTGNYTSCKIYAPDLDYGETYYRGTNGSGAVTYCTECEGWFEASHREDGAHGSIDDVRYLPWESASSKDSTIARIGNTTFYEDHICTEDCDEECALAGTRVPVYTTDPQFSTSKKYFRDPNVKNTAVTYVCEYCDICEKWVSNYHCTGGTVRNPESYTFYENHVCTEECLEECELAGKRVVVDTTSPDFSTEKEYYRDANVSHTSATYVIKYCSMCQRWISNTHGHSASAGDERIPYERGTYGKTVYDLFHIPCVSLLKGAKNAIEAFIDEVYEKSKGPDGISGTDDDVHHRVALTGFSGGPSNGQMKIDYRPYSGNWTRSGIFSVWNSDLEEAAQWYENTGYDGSIETQNFVSYWNIDSTTNKTELARAEYFYSHALRDVTSEIERAVLAEGMEDYAYEYGTETHYGVRMANEIFEHNLDPNRNRVYVLFTDGEPSDNARDPALKAASGIKNHEDYTATIYTIGTFAKSSSDNIYPLPSQSTNKFLTLLSSNFTNNTSIGKNAAGKSYKEDDVNPVLWLKDEDGNYVTNAAGERVFNVWKTDSNNEYVLDSDGKKIPRTDKGAYYLTADDGDSLVKAFENVAQSSTVGGADIVLNSSTIVQDVISEGWEIDIPDGMSLSDVVKAYTLEYVANVDGVKQWNSTEDVFEPTVEGKKVTVSGFDFSQNYVGIDNIEGEKKPRGKKLVLEINVKPTSENRGGANQFTNSVLESGIIFNDAFVETFDTPMVDLPVELTIDKWVVNENEDKPFEFEIIYDEAGDYLNNNQESGNHLIHQKDSASLSESIKASDDALVIGNIKPYVEPKADVPDSGEGDVPGDESGDESGDEPGDESGDEPGDGSGEEPGDEPGDEPGYDEIVESDENKVVIIEKNVKDYKVEVSFDGGTSWNDVTVDAEGNARIAVALREDTDVIFRNTYLYNDLTIEKTVSGSDTPESSFVFTVTGTNSINGDTVQFDVVIPTENFVYNEDEDASKGKITIKELPVGTYTVKENVDWSWRYKLLSENPISALKTGIGGSVEVVTEGVVNGGTVNIVPEYDITMTFANEKTNPYWLSGDYYIKNLFNPVSQGA